MTVLVDSDILIEVTRGKDASIVKRWLELSESGDVVVCSPLSVAELWHGARSSEHETLIAFFRSLVCVPIDETIGRLAGEYLARYHKSHGLELGDALIASTATGHGAALWTRNRRHYPMRNLSFF